MDIPHITPSTGEQRYDSTLGTRAWYISAVSYPLIVYNAIAIVILPVLIALLIDTRGKEQRLLPIRVPVEIGITCYVVGAAGVGRRV
jgi:hypothetical protein